MKCQHQNLQVQVPTFESDANGVLNTEHLLGISAIASDELGTGLVAEGRRSSRGHLQKFLGDFWGWERLKMLTPNEDFDQMKVWICSHTHLRPYHGIVYTIIIYIIFFNECVCVCCWDMNWAPAGLIPNGLQHCLQNIADLKEKGQKIRDNRQDWGDTKYTASWDSTAVVMLEPFFQLQMHQTCSELMLMKMLRDHTWFGITSEYAEDFCMRLYIMRFIYI